MYWLEGNGPNVEKLFHLFSDAEVWVLMGVITRQLANVVDKLACIQFDCSKIAW